VSAGEPEIEAPFDGEVEGEPTPTGTRLLEGATAIPTAGTTIATIEPPTPIATATAAATGEAAAMPGSGGILPAENGFLVWAGVGLLVLLIVGVTGRLKRS
jgi:hypothetical protein